jgi:hypothetical protein
MILKTLKKHDLKLLEFMNFCNLSKTQFNYALKKNDPIYLQGLSKKLEEFISYKIKHLSTELENIIYANNKGGDRKHNIRSKGKRNGCNNS